MEPWFKASDIGEALGISSREGKRLIQEFCVNPQSYSGSHLQDLISSDVSQVTLLDPWDAKRMKTHQSISLVQAMRKLIDGVVEEAKELQQEQQEQEEKRYIVEDIEEPPAEPTSTAHSEPTSTAHSEPTSTAHKVWTTDSREFADKYGRQHKNVLRDIRKEVSKPDSKLAGEVELGEVSKEVGKGAVRSFPVYHLTARAVEILEQRMRSTRSQEIKGEAITTTTTTSTQVEKENIRHV